uniref:Uncharacterized protein n=1 Tax=Anopheles dirus TaxID=7168 RepID=A0A182N6K9_9DIPT
MVLSTAPYAGHIGKSSWRDWRVMGPSIGIAMVPYYRQLLPTLNLYKQRRVNIADRIDFRGGRRIGDVVNATLELLEQCGGPDAYLNIKYMVPTYESCVYNR